MSIKVHLNGGEIVEGSVFAVDPVTNAIILKIGMYIYVHIYKYIFIYISFLFPLVLFILNLFLHLPYLHVYSPILYGLYLHIS